MDTSRRAVEAYWRSRMVDGVTSDEDKVAAVYKLEEICELVRSSHPSIVKEVSDYILKRLDHKSPVVKQKALRLIKYAVGKSGSEFRREMQRHSVAMRQLFHYKGQPDPLKGDSLNKAVRDTAHEAISAVFVTDDVKAASASAPTEGLTKRIEGFGSTNFVMPTEEKKSFLSEVVGMGSASIMQGLSNIAGGNSMMKADNGGYKRPTLRRSLTTEIDNDGYEGGSLQRESWVSPETSRAGASGTWNPNLQAGMVNTAPVEENSAGHTGVKSREERLLDTIVTPGGVRLQPTRDAIQAFLVEASKLDAVAMSRALDTKLQSPLWQVRMKAICVLESILRKKDDEHFSIVASYFSENVESVVKCSELPQVSLREKASKVLGLLDGNYTSEAKRQTEEPSSAKDAPVIVQVPDLIDTGDPNDYGSEPSSHKQTDQGIGTLSSTGSLVDDLLAGGPADGQTTPGNTGEHDPFADVSFHATEDTANNDIFSGLTVDDRRYDTDINAPKMVQQQYILSDNSEQYAKSTNERKMDDLMSGLTLNGTSQENKQPGGIFSGITFFDGNGQPSQLPSNGALNGVQTSSALYPMAPMPYNLAPNILNHGIANQPINYGAMGTFIAQQQMLFQNLGNPNSGFVHPSGTTNVEGYSPALPDIFQLSNAPVQSHGSVMSKPKKEDTRAFDFIADHLSAARDSKRVL